MKLVLGTDEHKSQIRYLCLSVNFCDLWGSVFLHSKNMLPKINRLTKKTDFDKVFRGGRGYKNDFLAFKFLKNDLANSRFGFIVSKKVSNKANSRNKIKRWLRAAVFGEIKKIKKLGKKTVKDVVIVALPPIKEKSFQEIKEAIEDFFKNP